MTRNSTFRDRLNRQEPPITIRLVETNVLTRWPCTVCGGCTEKVSVLCESNPPRIRVCEQCLKQEETNKGHIDSALRKHAIGLEQEAARVRSLIGRLNVPSYAEWSEAHHLTDLRYGEPAVIRGHWKENLKWQEGKSREILERLIEMSDADLVAKAKLVLDDPQIGRDR
jgi:hypothetical protein